MATAQDRSKMVKCPICLENYTEPRKMTNCEHSFCKQCIVTYVGTLKDNKESENGVPCPFCRTKNPGPKNRDEISAWCESLERTENNQRVNRENDEKESTGSNNNCGSCSIFGISTKATKLCQKCAELLCVSCSMGRHSQRSHRNHKVIDLEVGTKVNMTGIDLKTLKILRQYSYCSIHSDMELEYICEKDGSLCCNKCLVLKQCHGVKELKGDMLESKAKSEIESLKQAIFELSRYSKSLIEAKIKNEEENKKNLENIPKHLQDIRTKIIKLLDTIEETTKEQAKSMVKNIEISSENDRVTLNETLTSLDNASNLIDNVVKYGNVSQMYAALDKTKDLFVKCELSICDMADAFKPECPELVIDDSLENMIHLGVNETNSLAKVIKNCNEVTLPLYHGTKSARILNVTKTFEKSIRENYNLRGSPTYSSLIFLPNNQAVLTDTFSSHCCLTNKAFDVIGSRKFAHENHSCSYTRCGKIVVNSTADRKIYFLRTDYELRVINEVTTANKPRTIQSLRNGNLAVGWSDPIAFGIISSEAMATDRVHFTRDKSGRELKTFEYMAIDEDRKHVMQPCTTDNALYCFDFGGNPLFEYRSSNLHSPRGVALDRNGNVFLCSYENSVIHVISPTGRAIRMIKEGCPNKPLAIAFKSCGDEFAVTRGYVRGEDDRVVTFFRIQREK